MQKKTVVYNEGITVNLPILSEKNYEKWCKQMKVLSVYHDVLEVTKNRVTILVEGATYAQRSKHYEEKMKNYKALFFIHQCVDMDNFRESW